MNDSSVTYWRIPERAQLAWRQWEEDEFVFHHFLSNDTHQLSGVAGELMLRLLERGELETRDLAECCGLPLEYLRPLLQTLADLDFITWR